MPHRVAATLKRRIPGGAGRAGSFNFVADHMTLLVDPALYNLVYAFTRIVLKTGPEAVIYEKRKRWPGVSREASMTFAVCLGGVERERSKTTARTIVAVVQPTEPPSQSSHVRDILAQRSSTAHWQHVALRTPDLFAFHAHALAHGVNFITPVMRDADEDLLQVFTGELYAPGARPTGLFFEFVQRDPTPSALARLKRHDRQMWFRDRTFLGLYAEKEREYQSGRVTPLFDHALMEKLAALWRGREPRDLKEADLEAAAALMRAHRSPGQ